MVRQLALQFKNIPSYTPTAFVVGECNRSSYDWLMSFPKWNQLQNVMGSLITGDPSSGKTHLCHVLLDACPEARLLNGGSLALPHPFDIADNFIIVDDADKAPLPWLFHLYNHMKGMKGYLVLTMSRHYKEWCTLNDLSSRLTTIPHFVMDVPDDVVMISVLKNKLNDFGILVDNSALLFLIQHIERSYASLDAWVAKLNQLSAEQKKSITIPFIRSILNNK